MIILLVINQSFMQLGLGLAWPSCVNRSIVSQVMAGRQSAAQNFPKFTLKMKDERMKYIVTVFQYFILSQNFLAELCHERYQDKICEEGRGDETFLNFPRKRSSTSRLEQCDQKAMITRSGAGDEEQRKEDERDIDWIFSFVVSLYLCDRLY